MGESYNYTRIKYLYAHEKEKLFNIIKSDNSKYQIRNYAIFLLAEYCGLRASEVGMIRISEYNRHTKEIYIKRLKNSNNNTLRIIDKEVSSALENHLSERNNIDSEFSEFMFVSQMGHPVSRKLLDVLMKNYCRKAGIPKDKAHFHTLKHTRAVELGELGLDTKEIQYWIGHKEIKSTEVYFQFTTRQQEILYRKIAHFSDFTKNDKLFY